MSENPQDFTKNLVEDLMMNAVENSIFEIEDENRSLFEQALFEPQENLTSPASQDSNSNISEILQKVAELAESLREDLRNIQIGEYVVSMNVSPLEIQVKQAITNLQIADEEKNVVITKVSGGDDDDEHHSLTDIPISVETDESVDKNIENEAQHLMPQTTNTMDLEQSAISNLKKQKKKMNLGERLRRLFRFTLSRRKNS